MIRHKVLLCPSDDGTPLCVSVDKVTTTGHFMPTTVRQHKMGSPPSELIKWSDSSHPGHALPSPAGPQESRLTETESGRVGGQRPHEDVDFRHAWRSTAVLQTWYLRHSPGHTAPLTRVLGPGRQSKAHLADPRPGFPWTAQPEL